jgi:hypothetical protein
MWLRATRCGESLDDRKKHHNNDDKDENIFGQIIHIQFPRCKKKARTNGNLDGPYSFGPYTNW